MSHKEDIDKITNEITALEERSIELSERAYNLRQKREEIYAKIIVEEKVFDGTRWEISVGGGFLSLSSKDPHLVFLDAGTSTGTLLQELGKKDYHSWFEIKDGIKLNFDDGEISLSFQDPKMILPFVKKHGITVVATSIVTHLAKLKREVAALETLCHQYNL